MTRHILSLSEPFIRDMIVNAETFEEEILIIASKVDKDNTSWKYISEDEKEFQLRGTYIRIIISYTDVCGEALFFFPGNESELISFRLSKYFRDNISSLSGIDATFKLFNRYGIRINTKIPTVDAGRVSIIQADISRIARKEKQKQSISA